MIPDNAPVPALRIGVVIVSYHRAELLRNCLAALSRQDRLPDQVVVAGVQGDTETRAVVEAFDQASRVAVPVGGKPAARRGRSNQSGCRGMRLRHRRLHQR